MLTDKAIQRLKPRTTLYRVADSAGLAIEVTPAGTKLWRYRFRIGGAARMIALGSPYPTTSLADARELRDAQRKLLKNGGDPSLHRKRAKQLGAIAAGNTFEAIAREWLAVKANGWVPSQQLKERRRLELHAFPWIGTTPIADIRASDIKPLLSRLVKRGTLDMAHRLRGQISAIFKFAAADDRVTFDPADSLRETLPEHHQTNYAALLDASDPNAVEKLPVRVGELLRAIDAFKGQFPTLCALKLAALLFVRPGELRAAAWSEFNLSKAEWRIPASRRKLRKRFKEDPQEPPHIVPLSSQAVAILGELQPLTGDGEFLFPGARDSRRPMSDATINAALARLGYDGQTMSGHGWRHVASTLLHELNYEPDIIEAQLSHQVGGIRGVYNKAKHVEKRREMMQSWADFLDALRAGADVVPLRKSA